jgi:hypothetical protein
VSDTRALESATGWRARTGWQQGVARLAGWLEQEHAGDDLRQKVIA